MARRSMAGAVAVSLRPFYFEGIGRSRLPGPEALRVFEGVQRLTQGAARSRTLLSHVMPANGLAQSGLFARAQRGDDPRRRRAAGPGVARHYPGCASCVCAAFATSRLVTVRITAMANLGSSYSNRAKRFSSSS